jgi:hypothetical protein
LRFSRPVILRDTLDPPEAFELSHFDLRRSREMALPCSAEMITATPHRCRFCPRKKAYLGIRNRMFPARGSALGGSIPLSIAAAKGGAYQDTFGMSIGGRRSRRPGKVRQALETLDLALAAWSGELSPNHPFPVDALAAKMVACMKPRDFEKGGQLIPETPELGISRFGPDRPARAILLNSAAGAHVGHPALSNMLRNYTYVLDKLNRKEEASLARAERQVSWHSRNNTGKSPSSSEKPQGPPATPRVSHPWDVGTPVSGLLLTSHRSLCYTPMFMPMEV